MSSINTYRDSTLADYLNEIRKEQAAAKAGNTSQRNFTPHYITPASDSSTTSDTASVNPNVSTASDTSTTVDSATATAYTLPFTWPLKGDGSDQSSPDRADFCEWGA